MPERAEPDACPGALRVHEAADGGLARVRVPGGRLTAHQVRALADAAQLGDGGWELTSRANLQVRGLASGAEFAGRLAGAGLLPSATHERVRNVIASPGSDGALDVHAVSRELDERLCAVPGLAELPGRFLFTVDDGCGDVTGLRGDVGLLPVDDSVAVLLSGVDKGIRVAADAAARAAVLAAEAFLAERAQQRAASWRLAELTDGASRITQRVLAALGISAAEPVAVPDEVVPTHAHLGLRQLGGGRVSVAAGAPLGRLSPAQVACVSAAAEVAGQLRLTPWRNLVLPGIPRGEAATLLSELDSAGLVVDESAPLAGITACTGSPGCAKSLADVRTDAARTARPGELPVHWAGCSRRCGRPAGRGVEVLATEAGYEVGGKPAGSEPTAALEAARRAL